MEVILNEIFCFLNSDAKRRADLLLLSLPDERPAVDMAANAVLHNVPPVEFEARIRGVHTSRSKVCHF